VGNRASRGRDIAGFAWCGRRPRSCLVQHAMRVALALMLGLFGCRSDVSGPLPGGGAGDQAGDGGSLDGPKVNLARACRGYVAPPPTARLCRSDADCPSAGQRCLSPNYSPPDLGGCVTGAAPPSANCARDLDCKAGEQCLIEKFLCHLIPRCKPSSCAQGGCSKDERCRPDGRCEPIPCTEGWSCPSHLKCGADPMAPGRDLHGCVPRLCTEDFICPPDQKCADPMSSARDPHGCVARLCTEGQACAPGRVCDVGGYGADARGCRVLTCADSGGPACPVWQRCDSLTVGTTSIGTCYIIQCKTDSDCPCGICNGACDSGPGTCGYPVTAPP